MIVPYMIGFILLGSTWHTAPWYMLASPLVLTTGRESAAPMATPVVLTWLVLGLLLSWRWVLGQWRQFAPLEPQK